MNICVNCGRPSNTCLCDVCKENADLEALCNDILDYAPEVGENQLWNQIARELAPNGFKSLVLQMKESLPSSRKEYVEFLFLTNGCSYVLKQDR